MEVDTTIYACSLYTFRHRVSKENPLSTYYNNQSNKNTQYGTLCIEKAAQSALNSIRGIQAKSDIHLWRILLSTLYLISTKSR